ncbi:MAG: SoxR reducing system RseC family protein [Candidatus Thiodiazotropha sp.]
MIEEPASVISVDDGYAYVETQKSPACGACSSAGSCSTSVLSGLFKRRHTRLKVVNPIAAKPGDQVIIGLAEDALLKVSFMAYLLPLLSMLLMALLMQALASRFTWQIGELPQVVGGLLGLIAGFFLLKRLAGQRRDKPSYQAVIIRLANTKTVEFSREYVG